MSKFIVVGDTRVMEGSKCYDLLTSSDRSDVLKGQALLEYTRKAAACGYFLPKIEKLRKEFKDVL